MSDCKVLYPSMSKIMEYLDINFMAIRIPKDPCLSRNIPQIMVFILFNILYKTEYMYVMSSATEIPAVVCLTF